MGEWLQVGPAAITESETIEQAALEQPCGLPAVTGAQFGVGATAAAYKMDDSEYRTWPFSIWQVIENGG